MFAMLGIIIGVLFLMVLSILVAEIDLNSRVRRVQERQEKLENSLILAKDLYKREMLNNNKEVAKELSKLERNSACFVGHSERVPVSILLFTLITYLGLDVTGREFKIIKKGDQGRGKEREKNIGEVEKKQKN